MKRSSMLTVMLVAAACGDPDLDGLDPNTGPERTLVRVDGDALLATTAWDAETATEQLLPGGFLGAYLFSVPAGAAVAAHDVQLVRGSNRGNKVPFTVTAATPFGAPRLDRVSVVGTEFQAGNKVNTWLYVQGANVDVGAEVLVDGAVQPTVAHKGLRNPLFGIAPATLGNPLYHHLAMVVAPGVRDAGVTIAVRIQNADGQLSNIINYVLPLNAATVDSDGDDIPDTWEVSGYDANGDGTIDVDLPALGADPYRPDVLVEVDVMQALNNPPGAAAFQAIRDAFASAPVINPAEADGINLILDTSGTVPFWQRIDLTGADNPATGFANFYTLKAASFDNVNRGRLYHYCIWASARPNGSSGISDVLINAAGTDFSGPGDDCIVSFDNFGGTFQTARSGAETLMHELGHNLQQRHGGANHVTRNPTYSSVMSYSWQLRSGQTNAVRLGQPICAPLYYQQAGAVEVGGALPAVVGNAIDYSDGMGGALNEASLNEPQGVCNNVAVDWNGNGNATNAGAVRDIDLDGAANDVHVDFPNWASLVLSGPRQNGQYGN